MITNLKPRTYPKGHSIEIIKSNFYLENYKFITNNYDKEHVTSYLYRKKNKIKIKSFISKKIFNNLNYCIDYKEDLLKIKKFLRNLRIKFLV